MKTLTGAGLLMVLGGFLLKSALNHNIGYWGPLKTWTPLIQIFGLMFISAPLVIKIDRAKPYKFLDSPVKWLVNRLTILLLMAVAVAVIIKLEDIAVVTNQKLRDHYISRSSATTTAIVIGQVWIPYSTKSGISYQEFAMVRYSTDTEEILEQGIEGRKLIAGRQLRVRYSKSFPSFFRIE